MIRFALNVCITFTVCFICSNTGMAMNTINQNTVVPTHISMNFYGYIDQANIGDIITVTDSNGIVCGSYVIQKSGQYGFLPVYGDDPTTSTDEGACPGDSLTFYKNGETLEHDPIVWSGDRMQKRIDF